VACLWSDGAVDQWNKSIIDLQKARGEIWGDARFQFQRRAFIDNALLAGSLATKWVNALPIQTQMSICELSDWHIHRGAIATIGRDVDPQAWLPDVLARINDHAIHRLDELLPWDWSAEMERRKVAA
jgi:IS66 C-terminal element